MTTRNDLIKKPVGRPRFYPKGVKRIVGFVTGPQHNRLKKWAREQQSSVLRVTSAAMEEWTP